MENKTIFDVVDDVNTEQIQKWGQKINDIEKSNKTSNFLINIEKMQKILHEINTDPPEELIKTNPLAQDTKYLPISYLEMMLDQLTAGIWEVTNFHYEVIVNELTGKLNLRYYYPVIDTFINRIGVGAVQIQTIKGKDPYDTANKIQNALTKQMGQLKAECFRNAVKSIGKIFGRDLNRKNDIAAYNPMYDGDEITTNLSNKSNFFISKEQQIQLFKGAGNNQRAIKEVIEKYGYKNTKTIKKTDFNKILGELDELL